MTSLLVEGEAVDDTWYAVAGLFSSADEMGLGSARLGSERILVLRCAADKRAAEDVSHPTPAVRWRRAHGFRDRRRA